MFRKHNGSSMEPPQPIVIDSDTSSYKIDTEDELTYSSGQESAPLEDDFGMEDEPTYSGGQESAPLEDDFGTEDELPYSGGQESASLEDDFGTEDELPYSGGQESAPLEDDFGMEDELPYSGGQESAPLEDDFGMEDEPTKKTVSSPHKSTKASTRSSTPRHPVTRAVIALIAIVLGICVLFIIKVKNSVADDSFSVNDKGTAVVTPSDRSETKSASQEDVSSEAPEYKELHFQDYSDAILSMQKRLCELGFYDTESCTGYFGEYTVKRLKAFQKAAGLKPTGKADPETLARLYADDAPKASSAQ